MKNLTTPPSFIDLRDVGLLNIQISSDGKTVWVNAEHNCVLRVQKIEHLGLNDGRRKR